MSKYILFAFLFLKSNLFCQIEIAFNCKILNSIFSKIEEKKTTFEIYSKYIKDSFTIVDQGDGVHYLTKSNSILSNVYIDSIRNLYNIKNFDYVFNDSIFYFTDTIIIVDTFNFFNGCENNYYKSNIEIKNNLKYFDYARLDNYFPAKSIIFFKGLRTHGNHIVFVFQHIKSNKELLFFARIFLTGQIVIDNVFREFPIYSLRNYDFLDTR